MTQARHFDFRSPRMPRQLNLPHPGTGKILWREPREREAGASRRKSA